MNFPEINSTQIIKSSVFPFHFHFSKCKDWPISAEEEFASFSVDSIRHRHNEILKSRTLFSPSSSGLIANGWQLGPLEADEVFLDSDFALLESFLVGKLGLAELSTWAHSATHGQDQQEQVAQDLIVKVNCIIGNKQQQELLLSSSGSSPGADDNSRGGERKKRVRLPTSLSAVSSSLVSVAPRRGEAAFFDATLIVDPLSRHSQKVSTMVRVLAKLTNIKVTLYFNCREKLSAPPLKSFYRYVLDTDTDVKKEALFRNMPGAPILTMNLDVSESWMVEPVNAPYDLDNICLNDLRSPDERGVHGEFELEHLIVEGHAFDVQTGQSPRGLQFNL